MADADRHQMYVERSKIRQRAYAARYRAKKRENRIPDARDVGGALLALMLEKVTSDASRGKNVNGVVRYLVEEGFDDQAVRDVIDGMVDRYRYMSGR